MQVQGTGPQFAVNGRSTERVLKKQQGTQEDSGATFHCQKD